VPHVSTPPPEHCVALGMQTPHAPFTHTVPVHNMVVLQVPIEPHVCTQVPAMSHCTAPGVHVPTHLPATHAVPEHADPAFIQVPVGLQPWGCCPLHCNEPGSHWTQLPPVHTGVPPLHALPTGCHCPFGQKMGWFPMQDSEPTVHGPASTIESPVGPSVGLTSPRTSCIASAPGPSGRASLTVPSSPVC
jgi:hypothetical protein